ncbi:MAG: translation elongation factor Ts [Acidobacteriota bacterium]|nr:translation elongation factor Ts [Acidobacteriota bacterium]
MAISAAQVKQLRDKTGAGFMDCKLALAETDGDIDQAVTILRTRGQARAAKRSGRTTGQGLVGSYIHMGGQVGVLVEVGCESDFVARTDEFQQLTREIAMHIAAASPLYVTREQVPETDLEREKSIFRAQFEESNKPPAVLDKIVEGKMNSYYQQVVLLDQPSIRDPKTSIGDLVTAAIAKMGENITVSRFARFKIGESAE